MVGEVGGARRPVWCCDGHCRWFSQLVEVDGFDTPLVEGCEFGVGAVVFTIGFYGVVQIVDGAFGRGGLCLKIFFFTAVKAIFLPPFC